MKECVDGDQLCQSDCFFKLSNEQFNRLTGCMTDNKCIPNLTWSNQTCPAALPGRVKSFPVSLLAAKKRMFVARGSHPIFDCFPCQQLEFSLTPDNSVSTRWTTDLGGIVRGAE